MTTTTNLTSIALGPAAWGALILVHKAPNGHYAVPAGRSWLVRQAPSNGDWPHLDTRNPGIGPNHSHRKGTSPKVGDRHAHHGMYCSIFPWLPSRSTPYFNHHLDFAREEHVTMNRHTP